MELNIGRQRFWYDGYWDHFGWNLAASKKMNFAKKKISNQTFGKSSSQNIRGTKTENEDNSKFYSGIKSFVRAKPTKDKWWRCCTTSLDGRKNSFVSCSVFGVVSKIVKIRKNKPAFCGHGGKSDARAIVFRAGDFQKTQPTGDSLQNRISRVPYLAADSTRLWIFALRVQWISRCRAERITQYNPEKRN